MARASQPACRGGALRQSSKIAQTKEAMTKTEKMTNISMSSGGLFVRPKRNGSVTWIATDKIAT
jgi:hypothetical protein